MTEEKSHVLWEYDGYRLVRIGGVLESLSTAFESALWDDDMKIVGWQDVKATQIGMLLDALREWFDFEDRGLEKVEIYRTVLSGDGWKASIKTKEFDERHG